MARNVILWSGFVRIVRLRLTITIALFPSYDGTIGFSIHTMDDAIGPSVHLNIPTLGAEARGVLSEEFRYTGRAAGPRCWANVGQ